MKNLYLKIRDFTDGISDDNISAHAAASAFYMFLSLVPFVALVSTILPLTGLEEDRLFEIVSHYIPAAMQGIITSAVTDIYSAPNAILPISIIITVWLSSRAFSSLIRGVEDVADSPRYSSYLKRSLLACLYTIGIVFIMVMLLLLLVFGDRLSSLPILSPFVRIVIKLRLIVVVILLTCVFIAIYHWVPGMRLRLRQLLPGFACRSSRMAAVYLAFLALHRLWRRIHDLRKSCRNYHHLAVDVLVHVHHLAGCIYKYVYIPQASRR